MPRIPSAADVAPVGAAASRLPAVRADAADFGLAAAQGLAEFGEGLMAARPLAEEILRKEEKRKEAEQEAESKTHNAEMRETAFQAVDRWEYDGSPPFKAAQQFATELAAAEDVKLKGLPAERQEAARQGSAGVRAAYGLHIAQRAQNASVEALHEKRESTLRLLQGQAVREPLAAERFAADGTALLQSQVKAGALTPDQFALRNEAFRRGLFAAAIQSRPAVDAAAALEAGVYDAALDDPALKDFLLTQTRWRLQSEQAQAKAAAGVLVEAARHGASAAPALSARTQRLMADGDVADAERAIELAQRERQRLERLRYAPAAVVREEIAKLAPAGDAVDAEARGRQQEEVRIQVEAMLRDRRHDPAAYVMNQPAVAEAFAAAERDPTLLGHAVAAGLAAQAALGLSPEERRALTRDERAQVLAGLDALPPTERIAALGELARRYGEQSGPVAAELEEAGLSPVEALLLDPSGQPVAWRGLARLVARQDQGRQPKAPEEDSIADATERLAAGAPRPNAS